MFGKKEERPSTPNAMNQFGQGTVITGDVSTEGDIRIDGRVTGNVSSKAKVVIGATGVVDGDIVCQNAYIDGRVNGNMDVAEMLILSGSSNIAGDLRIKKLVVQEGAKFNGKCTMGMTVTRSESADKHATGDKVQSATF